MGPTNERAALGLAVAMLAACAAPTDLPFGEDITHEELDVVRTEFLASLVTDRGATIEFHALDDGDLAFRTFAPGYDAMPEMTEPHLHQMTALEMWDAFSDDPPPPALIAAQDRWNTLRASRSDDEEPREEPTALAPENGDGLGTVQHALTGGQFYDQICDGIAPTAWRDDCHLDRDFFITISAATGEVIPSTLRVGDSNRADRMWLYTFSVLGTHTQAIHRSRWGRWQVVIFSNGTAAAEQVTEGTLGSIGVAAGRRRSLRAVVSDLLLGQDEFHAAMKWFRD